MWPKGHCGCSVRVDEVGNGHLEPGDQPQPRPRPPLRTFADGDPASRSPCPARPQAPAPPARGGAGRIPRVPCTLGRKSPLEVTLERKSRSLQSGRNRGKGGKREEAALARPARASWARVGNGGRWESSPWPRGRRRGSRGERGRRAAHSGRGARGGKIGAGEAARPGGEPAHGALGRVRDGGVGRTQPGRGRWAAGGVRPSPPRAHRPVWTR